MSRRRGVLAGLAVLAALVVVAVAVFWPRGTTEISEDDAVEEFRQSEIGAETSGGPDPGVYTYAADGRQEVKLGPLPAETRQLPETITVVVAGAGDECFDLTVNFFAEHTEDTRYCTTGDRFRLDRHTKHQQIGALSPTATMTCAPGVLADPATEELELHCRLELDEGPVSIRATLVGTATTGTAEIVDVGGREVEATPLSVSYDVTGDLSGSWDETTWWTGERLPTRIERTIDLQGPATLTERSRLDLVAVEPRT